MLKVITPININGMRRVIFQMMVSIDGYFEGENHEIDWHNVDEDFNRYSLDFLNNIDTLVFGRTTYELMASYWTTEAAVKDAPLIAEKMNSLQKIVFSNTLEKAEWNKSRLMKTSLTDEIARQKLRQCKDIAIFGSSDLTLSLIPSGLINEFRIIVNPIFLGKGKTLLEGLDSRIKVKLLYSKTFKSGNVLLCYVPISSDLTKSSFLGEMIN
jgi:dihydrofolate reductase